jgi:hypothetical protein
MDFEIKITITNEFPDDNFKVDLIKLQNFLVNRLDGKFYGESVVKFFWGLELFKFNGGFAQFFRNDIESWKHSVKWFVVNSNFDWVIFNQMEEKKALILLKDELLNSVNRIDNMKKKPKDFNHNLLREDLNIFMMEYINRFE